MSGFTLLGHLGVLERVGDELVGFGAANGKDLFKVGHLLVELGRIDEFELAVVLRGDYFEGAGAYWVVF